MVHSRTKIVAGISITICAVSCAVFLWLLYTLSVYESRLYDEKEAAVELDSRQKKLASMEKLVEETKTARTELNQLILTEDQVVEFLTMIEGIGSALGLKVETKALTVLPGKGTFEEISMNLVFEGGEASVLRAIQIIETLPYHSAIDRATLSRTGGSGTDWTADMDLRVSKFKK